MNNILPCTHQSQRIVKFVYLVKRANTTPVRYMGYGPLSALFVFRTPRMCTRLKRFVGGSEFRVTHDDVGWFELQRRADRYACLQQDLDVVKVSSDVVYRMAAEGNVMLCNVKDVMEDPTRFRIEYEFGEAQLPMTAEERMAALDRMYLFS